MTAKKQSGKKEIFSNSFRMLFCNLIPGTLEFRNIKLQIFKVCYTVKKTQIPIAIGILNIMLLQ